MKWLLISLAIGLAASDKLDRTYLPPPGAQFSGGILGSHDAPLELPHHTHSGQGSIIGGHEGSQTNFGINGEPVNFGDKIPKVPVTTTSYAFSQTTTYPPGEGFETTALPINPITGLPIQLGQENFPNGPFQGQQNIFNLPGITPSQAPTFGTNIQPGFGPQGPTSAPANNGNPGYNRFTNQPLAQYPGQNVIAPGGAVQVPGSVYPGQTQGQLQYPKKQGNMQQQGFLPTGAPDNQRFDQYPGQNVVNPGSVVQIPGGDQGKVQTVEEQQGFELSTGSPISLQPSSNQYGVTDDGFQGFISQGTPINVANLVGTQPVQTTYQKQEPINVGGNPSQYPSGNQNYGSSIPAGSQNVFQPGSTPSTIPSSYNVGGSPSQYPSGNQNYELSVPTGTQNVFQPESTPSTIPSSYSNGVSSTTLFPGVPSSTSSYSSVGSVYPPERPQAAADRNAVILNYENVRTPNSYSYSFDTSNGIHADENGIVDNGTKAQGSYSYIGDDGKVYSVIYTADENGFQPRGDHLPTPPPIPEAIQRVIEQAARDKAAGIVHDGSYDETKYGEKQYQGTANHRQSQKDKNQVENDHFNGAKDARIKPIVGIKDDKYDEGIVQDQFNNNLPVQGTEKYTNGKLPARRPSNLIDGKNSVQDVSEGNRRVLGDFDSPKGTFDGNSMPIIEEVINQQNEYGTKKQGSLRDRPMSNENNQPSSEAKDFNQNNQAGLNNLGPSTRRPLSGRITDVTEKYPGSNVDVAADAFSETEGNEFENDEGQNISAGSPNISDGSGETMNTSYDSNTGAPITGNSKKQMLRQRIKGNRRPGSNKNNKPKGETYTQEITEVPSIQPNFENTIKTQQSTQIDDTGYHYQQPNNKFEQNTFPTRFSPQEVSSMSIPDQRRTEYVEGTTLKPFMTPNVYDKNDRNTQKTPNGYRQNNINRQSTTRRPFTTVGVTSLPDNSYTDYDDGDNYATNQDIGDDRINSSRYPNKKGGEISRPYQSAQTTSRSQNVPGGQKTRVNQKGTVAPGRRTETSGTVSPGYTYGPTTQMPFHNSRFGSTEFPLRMKPQQRRPSTTDPDSATAVGSPVTTQYPLGTRPTDYEYQTTGPNSKYSGTNVGSGYPATGSFPGSGSLLTTSGVSTPQDYYTSTYGPTQGYPSTTAVSPTYGYTQGSGSQIPSEAPGSFQFSQDKTFQTGYHYGPPKSGPLNLDGTGNSEVFPTSPTETFQTTYKQGPNSFLSTTLGPVPSGQQGTFIPSQPGTVAPETSPFGIYQGNYQNGHSTPDYATTIISSTPEGKPVFQYPGSPGAQETTRYEYRPTRPTYSTTDSPSTIGTTPGSFLPSETTGPSKGYSTTYRPGFQTTKHTFADGPVDGFGRPIITEQGGSHPGYGHPTQGSTGPTNNLGPNFGGTDQSTKYPGSYDQTRVIGEDFSGPKQRQRFDPKTGYHY